MNEQARRMVEEGVAAARQGERGQARALLLQAADLAPDAFDAWLWLGGLEDDPRQAIQYLQRALALQPDSVRAKRGLEWAQRRVGDLEAAPPPEAAPGQALAGPSASDTLSGAELPGYGTSEFDRLVASLSMPSTDPEVASPPPGGTPAPAVLPPPLPSDLPLNEALAGLLSGPPLSEVPEEQEVPDAVPPHPGALGQETGGETSATVPVALEPEDQPEPEAVLDPEPPLGLEEALAEARQGLADGDAAAAARTLGRLAKQYPEAPEARQLLGVALYRAGDLGQAAALYEAERDQDGENPVALTNLGLVYSRMGRPEDAVPLLQRAVRANRESLEALVTLAEALRDAGRPREALAHFEEALRRRPDLTEIAEGLAATEAALGRLGKAVGRYRALMRASPTEAGLPLGLARLLSGARKRREALEACRVAVKIDPRCVEGHYLASRLLLEMKKRREALAVARAALAIEPDHAGATEVVRQLTAPPVRKPGLFARLFRRSRPSDAGRR